MQINRLAALIKTNNECQNIAESLNCHSSARNPCKGLVNEVKCNKYNLKNRGIQEKERERELLDKRQEVEKEEHEMKRIRIRNFRKSFRSNRP